MPVTISHLAEVEEFWEAEAETPVVSVAMPTNETEHERSWRLLKQQTKVEPTEQESGEGFLAST